MSLIHSDLQKLTVPIEEITPHPQNPRNGDIDAIAISLRNNGQYRPIVVNKRNNQILAGNHTYHAAMQLGWDSIAITYVDVDDDTAIKIMLVDNRTSDLSNNDDGIITNLLQDLPNLEGTGYTTQDLEKLLQEIGEPYTPETGNIELESMYGLYIDCENEKNQFHLLERLTNEGYKCRTIS